MRGSLSTQNPVSVAAAIAANAATRAEAKAGTSTTKAISPDTLLFGLLSGFTILDPRSMYFAVTGTGTITQKTGTSATNSLGYGLLTDLQTGATANSTAKAEHTAGFSGSTQKTLDYSKPHGFGITILPALFGDSSGANTVFRALIGNSYAAGTALTGKCVGFEVIGSGTTRRLWLVGHNGTSAFSVDSGIDIASGSENLYNIVVTGDGAGNVKLYRNGTQIATSSSGPSVIDTNAASASASITNGATAANAAYQIMGGFRLWLQ